MARSRRTWTSDRVSSIGEEHGERREERDIERRKTKKSRGGSAEPRNYELTSFVEVNEGSEQKHERVGAELREPRKSRIEGERLVSSGCFYFFF